MSHLEGNPKNLHRNGWRDETNQSVFLSLGNRKTEKKVNCELFSDVQSHAVWGKERGAQ